MSYVIIMFKCVYRLSSRLFLQEDDDLFPADGRAALDRLSEDDNDLNEVG